MDRFRNPNPRGESLVPSDRGGELFGDDDSVEGHSMAINRPDDEELTGSSTEEDVEGHRIRTATDEEDVEGHRVRTATDEEDVEGHSSKLR